jgi:inner membrane transporter RhtA
MFSCPSAPYVRGVSDRATELSTAGIRGSRLPPHIFFVGSAVFHYLGPAFAVLLFARIEPLGVAWLRIVLAASLFAIWRRPWRRGSLPDAPTHR